MHGYLTRDFGLSDSVARNRADEEINGLVGARICDELERLGLRIAGKRFLDLGAGLGTVSVELVRRGASVVSLEPGTSWYNLAAERLEAVEGSKERSGVIAGVGENLPLAAQSVDAVISMQVLEHVQNPQKVIEEVFRVLRPGGHFFFSYENYLGFWEPHYRVRWLPLLPKRLGSVYLRLLGRNPRFLNEAVTYTTFPAIRRILRNSGFENTIKTEYMRSLASPNKTSLKWRILRALSKLNSSLGWRLPMAAEFLRQMFRTTIYELVRKPGGIISAAR